MISASIILCIILAVCACGSHTEPAASSADITTASTPVNTDSTTDTTIEPTVPATTEMPAEESSAFTEPASMEEPSSAPADWDTTDPELMLKQMQESKEFMTWRFIMQIMPAYNANNADDLLDEVIRNIYYFNFTDFLTSYNSPDADFLQEDVGWYMMRIFHVNESAWEHARDMWNERMSDSIVYQEGYFHWTAAGGPGVGAVILIEDAQFDGECWLVHTRTCSEDAIDSRSGRYNTFVMAREDVNGEQVWTMYSKDAAPYYYYDGEQLKRMSKRWNTLEEPVMFENSMMDIVVPQGLKYYYSEFYDDNGDTCSFQIDLGRQIQDEATLYVDRDMQPSGIDDAVASCIERHTRGSADRVISEGETIRIGDRDYQHIAVRNDVTTHDYYVTCAAGSSGNQIYIEWSLIRSSLNDPLTVDDPQLIEIAESMVLK